MITLKNYGKVYRIFTKQRFFSNDKYDDFINDLYDEDILDDNDIDIIQNNKNNDKSDDLHLMPLMEHWIGKSYQKFKTFHLKYCHLTIMPSI